MKQTRVSASAADVRRSASRGRAIRKRRHQLLDQNQIGRALEQVVSRGRPNLHERINELRARIGLPRWWEQHDLGDFG